mmetsp:Transcript_56335/g.150629  ORF Transcript_56335/g.150629 Transcript_56335/m.150629 type:complete len:836 (-) Transcript_56335:79-2586(-)
MPCCLTACVPCAACSPCVAPIVEVSLASGCLGGVYIAFRQRRDHHLRQQISSANRLCEQTLERKLAGGSATRGTSKLPPGSDADVCSALRTIQDYQEKHKPRDDVEVPITKVGFLTFGGFKCLPKPPDVTMVICEDMKPFLVSLAAGSVPPAELKRRLIFYHQLLMRPEVFSQDAFLHAIAVVCQHLETVTVRLAGNQRTCATELTKIMSSGREFVDTLVPILTLAITDSLDSSAEALPQILNATYLQASASDSLSGQPDVFSKFWSTDAGRALKSLIHTVHFQEMWPGDSRRKTAKPRKTATVLDVWLELRHKWMDHAGSKAMSESGLFSWFQGERYLQAQQDYLDLIKHLDNFVGFLCTVKRYHQLSDVGGDAAMHYLRDGFHHLLQELQNSLVQVYDYAARVSEATKRTVTDMAIKSPRLTFAEETWISKLLIIDEVTLKRVRRALLTGIDEARRLTVTARLPELQQAARQAVEQLRDVTGSDEFRARASMALFGPDLSGQHALANSGLSTNQNKDVLMIDCPGPLEEPPAIEEISNETNLENNVDNTTTDSHVKTMVDDGSHSRASPPPVTFALAETVVVSPDEESTYYDMLLTGALIGVFGSEEVTATQAHSLLESSCLGDTIVRHILATEGFRNESGRVVPREALQRMSQLVAHCQAGVDVQDALLRGSPGRLPNFQGLHWDGHRLRVDPGGLPSSGALAAVPASTQPPSPEVSPEVSPEEEATFYEMLIGAVIMPFFGEAVTAEQAKALLQRSELPAASVQKVLSTELGRVSRSVDGRAVQRMCKLVAHMQNGCTDLRVAQHESPHRLPVLRGLRWDGRRLRCTEPFL